MPKLTLGEINKAYAEGGGRHPQADETHETIPSLELEKQIGDWYIENQTETTAMIEKLRQRYLAAIRNDNQFEIAQVIYEAKAVFLTALMKERVLLAIKGYSTEEMKRRIKTITEQFYGLEAMFHHSVHE